MNNLKLRPFDGVALCSFLILPSLFYSFLGKSAQAGHSAAWLISLAAFAIMLCLFLLIIPLMKGYCGKNIIEIASIIFGRPIAAAYSFILGIYFCVFTGIHIREAAQTLQIYSYNLTPLFIIAGIILITACLMGFLGERAIVKSAGLFFLIIISGVILVILLGLGRYNPDLLAPAFGNISINTLRSNLYTVSMFDGVMLLLLFAPSFENYDKLKKSGIITLLVCGSSFVLMNLCTAMSFPSSLASKLSSVFMEIGKASYYNHFFYRFESILLFFLIFASLFSAIIGLFSARISFAYAIKTTRHIPIILSCTILILCAVVLPENIYILIEGYLPMIQGYSMILIVGFPLIMYISGYIKGGNHEKA